MHAVRYHSFAATAPLLVEDIPVPEPAPGEVLVRVRCASLNPVDWKIAAGRFRLLVRGGLPRTMGSDFSGEIASVGRGVASWSPGEPVLGFVDPFKSRHGTFADYVPVPSTSVFRRPETVAEPLGAALTCVGVTAVMLCDLAGVGHGSRVLVNGAAGGVGHLVVQVASARGAHVTAVASAGRRDFVTSLGADAFIDYRSTPAEQLPGGFDAVVDCVPNLPRAAHRRLLRRGGHYASSLPGAATWTIDPLCNLLGPLVRRAVMLEPRAEAMRELLEYVDQGRLACRIEEEFALDDVAMAVERSRAGHVAGKLVIRTA
jgi:NADPH:quinone reductase-like Zn-dependent oxidoreductase